MYKEADLANILASSKVGLRSPLNARFERPLLCSALEILSIQLIQQRLRALYVSVLKPSVNQL